MPSSPSRTAAVRPLRADAVRNQGQILAAARDVFVERGPDAPLEEIAKRAGVGIGTLYRHFASRQELMRIVVLDALARTREAAERALSESPTAIDALVRYMHSVLDIRISAVIPMLLDRVDLNDEELLPARAEGAAALQQIVDAAQAERTLTADVSSGDIGMLLVRLARPLPGTIPRELNDSLAHRHLDLLIEGLRPGRPAPGTVAGPALTLEDLHDYTRRPPDA